MARKASKTSLGAFICDNTDLKLTQAKELAEIILEHADVEWNQGSEPEMPYLGINQLWQHESGDVLQIVDIELGPTGNTDSAVRYWEPVMVECVNIEDHSSSIFVAPEIFVEQCTQLQASPVNPHNTIDI